MELIMNKEYIDKIHETINKLEYENEEKSSKELLLESTIDFIGDVFDTTELIITSYDNDYLNVQLDGCDLLSDNEIALYIVDYSDNQYRINDEDINEYVKKVYNYYQKAKDGLSKKLNASDNIRIVSDYIYEKQGLIQKIYINVVTSKEYIGSHNVNIYENENVFVNVFDASYLKEHGYLQQNSEEVFVEFTNPLNFLKCSGNNEIMDVFLLFVKGEDIAKFYEKFGYRMLDGNVRAYLKKTNKQNKGILETIKDNPDFFVAYNNGLSTVADSVSYTKDDKIASIKGWKIVNGGQTTATIFEAYKQNGGKLRKDIYVPVKLTILKNVSNEEVLVSKIAEYANTQSKVSQSDLNSNEEYHVNLERLSRSVCVPSKVEGKELKKWYYERLRGQCNLERDRAKSLEAFEAEYPSENVFDKLDLAKAVMVWEQEPYTTATGKEKCFSIFSLRVKVNEGQYKVDEAYYKDIIALIILYRSIVKIVKQLKYGGFGSNIVEYTGAVLSLISNQKLDLQKIWKEQKLDEELKGIIEYIASEVTEIITDVPSNQKNVQMYCRQVRCWDAVRDHDFDVKIPSYLLSTDKTIILENNSKTVVAGKEIDINELDSSVWGEMSKWGKETNLLAPNERKMAFTACKIARSGYNWKSDKQRDFAKSVYMKAINNGFQYSNNE